MFDNNWQSTQNPTSPMFSTYSNSSAYNPLLQSMTTNISKVTSLEEAIMRTNTRNSEMVYFNQSRDEFYNIRVDINGNKSWQIFVYNVPNPNVNVPASRADVDALTQRIEKLEQKFGGIENEPNGQNTVQ